MLLTLQVLGSMLVTVPWIDSDWATDTVYIIIGVCIAILMIGKKNKFIFCFWAPLGCVKEYTVVQKPLELFHIAAFPITMTINVSSIEKKF